VQVFFDLQNNSALAADYYRLDRNALLSGYQFSEEVLQAIRNDDVVALSGRSNPFLLRYFFVSRKVGCTKPQFGDASAGRVPLHHESHWNGAARCRHMANGGRGLA
jgi:hypothetical protein